MVHTSKLLPRVLFTNPLRHLPIKAFEQKYNISILPQDCQQNQFVDAVNHFQPNAIYFTFHTKLVVTQTDFISNLSQEALNQLRVISNLGVGYDRIHPDCCTKQNIYVSNTPDVVSDATADITMSLILSCARKTTFFEKSLREGNWNAGGNIFGFDLKGKVLGLVGCGSIGKLVAKRAQAFGMNIIYFKRNRLSHEEEQELGLGADSYFSNLHEMLQRTDVVSVHTPLNNETKHLISTEEFKHMKNTAYIINTSRGPVVDEQALCKAISTSQIAGCGLDVYENEPRLTLELLTFGSEKAVLYPHIGTQTTDTRVAMETLAMQNIQRVILDNSQPVTPVPEQKNISMSK